MASIKIWTYKNFGSGTTAVASLRTNRDFIVAEKDLLYKDDGFADGEA